MKKTKRGSFYETPHMIYTAQILPVIIMQNNDNSYKEMRTLTRDCINVVR